MKRTINKIIRVIVFLCFLAFFRYFSSSEPLNGVTTVQYCFSSGVMTYCVCLIYKNITNKRISKKINTFIKMAEYNEAERYIKKECLKKPDEDWLKFQLMAVFALSGQIAEYDALKSNLSESKLLKKKEFLQSLEKWSTLVNYIKTGQDGILFFDNPDGNLEKTLNLISSSRKLTDTDYKKTANEVFASNIPLLKCISSLLLAKKSFEAGNTTEADIYITHSRKSAPSSEIVIYLEEHIKRI